MPTRTTFVVNEDLWREARRLIRRGRRLKAAIAYFGRNGSTFLPFRSGDQLVVDLSIASVRAGRSDPWEIEKLLRRGVRVSSRANLHAKIISSNGETLVGSANASGRAVNLLDEAAVLTSDPAVVRRARQFITSLSNEPVRPEYLAMCKREYRPPRFPNGGGHGRRSKPRQTAAKLWIVGLGEAEIPEGEQERLAKGEKRAKAMTRGRVLSETSFFWWSRRPAFASVLRPGDWVICATRSGDGTIVVSPPGQFLFLDSYPRGRGKQRYVFHLEVPRRGGGIAWSQFRRAAQRLTRHRFTRRPRTRAIRDVSAADALLRLWTTSGRPSTILRSK